MKKNSLTPEEEDVIVHKNTEPPFTGMYNDFYEEGIYVCRQCDNPLFSSEAKFNSGCGWPSFDEHFPGGILEIAERNGLRTQILCAKCRGHLGHVFEGEGYTENNIRNCVNSLSIKFIPHDKTE
jgi:methionine-R-sulfoxide reductase